MGEVEAGSGQSTRENQKLQDEILMPSPQSVVGLLPELQKLLGDEELSEDADYNSSDRPPFMFREDEMESFQYRLPVRHHPRRQASSADAAGPVVGTTVDGQTKIRPPTWSLVQILQIRDPSHPDHNIASQTKRLTKAPMPPPRVSTNKPIPVRRDSNVDNEEAELAAVMAEYNFATWRLYNRITTHRAKQAVQYSPPADNSPKSSTPEKGQEVEIQAEPQEADYDEFFPMDL